MPVEYNILFRCFILCRIGEYHKAAASGGGGGGALLVGQSVRCLSVVHIYNSLAFIVSTVCLC